MGIIITTMTIKNGVGQGDDNRYLRVKYHTHTGITPDGQFCALLEELLYELDHTVRPLYLIRHYVEPDMRDYYTTEVHIRVTIKRAKRWRSRSLHYSTAPFSTEAVIVNDVARRALWSINNSYRGQMYDTDFRFVPNHISGSEETVVPVGDNRDGRLDILARVTATLVH
jgi:hypothetical protein